MIKTLIYLGIILVGLCLSPYLVGNTGYLYLAAGDYEIETSLVFALVVIVIAYAVLVTAEWLLVRLVNLFIGGRRLPEQWRRNAAKKHTLSGALALAEEDWPAAERLMAKGADKGELPALNLLAAARAAQQQGKYAERDDYLAQISNEPNAEAAVLTSKARFLLAQGQLEQARQALQQLSPGKKSPPHLISLAMEIYRTQQDWPALRGLLPSIRKLSLLDEAAFEQLTLTTSIGMLEQAGAKDGDALDNAWQQLSRAEKQHSSNRAAYALALTRVGQKEDAIRLVLKDVTNNPAAELFTVLPQILNGQDDAPRQQLSKLADKYGEIPEYQECMAMLCRQARDFRAAREHRQKACELHPCRENWLSLAELDEQLGQTELALTHYRRAAQAA